MNRAASDYVTLVEVLELTRPYPEFVGAVRAFIQRLAVEGIRELVMMQVYTTPDPTEAGILLTFADRNHVVDHMNLIGEWAEFRHFATTVKPVDVRVYGQLNVEAAAWSRQFIDLRKAFDTHVAGFVR